MRVACKTALILITTFSIARMDMQAQVCQGSLGDPIVNITFGSGTNPGPPLSAAASIGYQYAPNDCPNDGYYTVRSNTANCFTNSWHTLSADHTGDPNGYFMLVNASFQPGVFYRDTVRGLCKGTTYEFAAWVSNVLKSTACSGGGIQPNLTFTIERVDGTVLNTYSTGNIPNPATPSWQQYGFFFATPAGVSEVVLKMVNNSPGGCGNDIALDDITFRPCGPEITVEIIGIPEKEVTICEGTTRSFTLDGTISVGLTNPVLRWQRSVNGSAWTDIAGSLPHTLDFPPTTSPGTYAYRLSAVESENSAFEKCRVASEPITITVSPSPVTAATSNSPQCEKSTLTMSAGGGTIYEWTGPNGFTAYTSSVSIPDVQVTHSGKYYVLVTDAVGCSKPDSIIATVNPSPVAITSFPGIRICEGGDLQLEASGGGSYQWTPATGLSSANIANPIAAPTDTTLYSVIVTNQFDCRDTAETIVNVVERPRANAGPDKYLIRGRSTQLLGIATGQDISYSWSPDFHIDDVNALQPMVTPPHDTSYLLTVVSNEGCGIATDIVKVYVYPDVYIPTAFSPNNDGLNDTWLIPALRAYAEFTVSVYNRHGRLIFHTKNNARPWDGNYNGMSQPADVYVYVVEIKEEKRMLKGTLMLVR